VSWLAALATLVPVTRHLHPRSARSECPITPHAPSIHAPRTTPTHDAPNHTPRRPTGHVDSRATCFHTLRRSACRVNPRHCIHTPSRSACRINPRATPTQAAQPAVRANGARHSLRAHSGGTHLDRLVDAACASGMGGGGRAVRTCALGVHATRPSTTLCPTAAVAAVGGGGVRACRPHLTAPCPP
jgi:hypothetical protein